MLLLDETYVQPIDLIPTWESPLREAHQREEASDDLAEARCPCCCSPLHLRCDCYGPHFECACARRNSR